MNVEQLFKLAHIRTSGTIKDEWRQSLPVPVVQSERLYFLFLFCPTQKKPRVEGIKIAPPNYVARLDAQTGKLEELRAVTPIEFGQSHDGDEIIGTFKMPDGMTGDQYREERNRLFSLYDRILPDFLEGKTTVDKQVREAAMDSKRLFDLLREYPLDPYYKAIGREFIEWLNLVAR